MAKTKTVETAPLKIVVLDRGWVFVGRVTAHPGELQIDDACCVRFWGTQKGLGQLASDGPLSATKLDPCPRVVAPGRAVMFTLDCAEDKWKNYR